MPQLSLSSSPSLANGARRVKVSFGIRGASIALVGVGLGLIPAAFSLSITLALASFLLLVVALTGIWLFLRAEAARPTARAWSSATVGLGAESRAAPAVSALALGRVLFFMGAATVAEVGWRPASLDVSDVLFLASFACCCFAVVRGRPVQRIPGSLAAGVCLFGIGGALSSISAAAPGQSAYELVRAIWVMLLWPWTATMLLRDRRDLVTAMLCWALSATVNGLGALGQITGISMIAGPLEAHRATGFTGHPNDLGGAVAVALVPVLTLAVRVPSRLGVMRVLKWIMLVVTAAALIVSGSVGGIVAAVLAGILWVTNPALGGRARMAIVLGLAAALLVTSTIGGTVTSPEKRFLQVVGRPGSAPNAGSAQSRIDVIIGAWPRIRQNPFIGTGMGNNNLGVPLLSNGVVQVDQVHNAFVAAWYETGIIGLAGLLLVLGAVLSLGWQAVLTARDRADRILGWALVCAFVAYIVYAMSAPLYFQQYGWFAGALVVACGVRVLERPVSVARRQDLWRQPELASP